MPENTTTVTLSQLVDVALNGPEVGAVNFNILHTLLHIIIQQLDRAGMQVEFQGNDSGRIKNLLAASKQAGPSLNLTEYVIKGGKSGEIRKKVKRLSLQKIVSKDDVKTKDKNTSEKKDDEGGGGSQTSLQRVIVVESTDGGVLKSLPTIAITKSHFDTIEDELERLKGQIKELTEMPANLGLLQAVKGDQPGTPILDMFQILNLSKRADAMETGIEKLASLIEDLAKNVEIKKASTSKELMEKAATVRNSIEIERDSNAMSKLESIEKRLVEMEKLFAEINGTGSETLVESHEQPDDKTSMVTESSFGTMNKEIESSQSPTIDKHESIGTESGSPLPTPTPKPDTTGDPSDFCKLDSIDLTKMKPIQATGIIQKQLRGICNVIKTEFVEFKRIIEEKQLEMKQLSEKIEQNTHKYTEMNIKLEQMENDVKAGISCGVGGGGGGGGMNEEVIAEITKKFETLEKEFTIYSEIADQFQAEKDDRQTRMEAMMEQIDLLKIVKADREDLEDALEDKADACLVNRKVSYEKFDAVCDDLNKGIESTVQKLTEQEDIWQEALDNMHKEIVCKLDKSDIEPIRDYMNNKLKILQDKVKALMDLKKEREAAGTKSKLLRDVNCISCDKDVVMQKRMDSNLRPKAPALPPTKSIAPHLVYELDELRKQKNNQLSRNMNYLETALKFGKQKDLPDNHLCNRYCGGSHTVTTAHQRVTRTGHFFEQWGPEISPIEEEYIRGNDNHLYKARDDTQVLERVSLKKKSIDASVTDRSKDEKEAEKTGKSPSNESATGAGERRRSSVGRRSSDKRQSIIKSPSQQVKTSDENVTEVIKKPSSSIHKVDSKRQSEFNREFVEEEQLDHIPSGTNANEEAPEAEKQGSKTNEGPGSRRQSKASNTSQGGVASEVKTQSQANLELDKSVSKKVLFDGGEEPPPEKGE